MGELFTTACIRMEGRPTRLYRGRGVYVQRSVEVGLEHIPGESTVSRGVLHDFPT